MQCTYKCTMKLDTLGTDTKTDRMILRIGQNISQFYSYTAYRTDSIWKTPNGKRIWGDAMVRAIRSKNYDQMPNANMISNDYIYKNYPEGKLSTYAQLGVTSALIEEDYTGQDWTLKDSTKTLLGYPCQLATCSYHGRDYQAWFTSEIAIDNGPWKFKGLPGLILEVYDTKDHYHFSIEGIERTNIAPVCFYYTLPDPRDAERIDRLASPKDIPSYIGKIPKIIADSNQPSHIILFRRPSSAMVPAPPPGPSVRTFHLFWGGSPARSEAFPSSVSPLRQAAYSGDDIFRHKARNRTSLRRIPTRFFRTQSIVRGLTFSARFFRPSHAPFSLTRTQYPAI